MTLKGSVARNPITQGQEADNSSPAIVRINEATQEKDKNKNESAPISGDRTQAKKESSSISSPLNATPIEDGEKVVKNWFNKYLFSYKEHNSFTDFLLNVFFLLSNLIIWIVSIIASIIWRDINRWRLHEIAVIAFLFATYWQKIKYSDKNV